MFGKKINTEIKVEGMHCEHCAKKVINALEELDNVTKVKVDLESKKVTITSKKELDMNEVKECISKLDYQVVE